METIHMVMIIIMANSCKNTFLNNYHEYICYNSGYFDTLAIFGEKRGLKFFYGYLIYSYPAMAPQCLISQLFGTNF